MADSAQAKEVIATKAWLNHAVVGLNFCPFAKREVERNTIRYILAAESVEHAVQHVLDELYHLDNHDDVETTLVILPSGFENFDDYLDLLDHCNMLIDRSGYRGKYQIASFHPDYCFEGEAHDSPSNYTNRSPYPILHLLREASLERVLNTYKNPENIPVNNINKANEMGSQALATLLKNCIT